MITNFIDVKVVIILKFLEEKIKRRGIIKMIVKAMIIGAVLGLVLGFFTGMPLQGAVTGAIFGVIVRKALFRTFWK